MFHTTRGKHRKTPRLRLGPLFWLEAAIAQVLMAWEGSQVSKTQRARP